MKLNRIGLSQTESGQVINLMSNDVNRFDIAALYLNYIWVMPIVVPVVSYLVWQHIGVATLAALAVIFLQTILVQGNCIMQLLISFIICNYNRSVLITFIFLLTQLHYILLYYFNLIYKRTINWITVARKI